VAQPILDAERLPLARSQILISMAFGSDGGARGPTRQETEDAGEFVRGRLARPPALVAALGA
jgi:hypothetical protein